MTDDRDDDVRRLLAEVGSEPTELPSQVAARLDDTLAGLVAERSTPVRADRVVVPLSRRSRSHLLLAAAAAVIVVGAGGAVLATLTAPESADQATTQRAESGGGADEQAPGEPGAVEGSEDGADQGLRTGLPVLRPGSFAVDAARLLDVGKFPKARPHTAPTPPVDCAGPRPPAGAETRPVLYGETPAVLVVHPPRGGTRVVEAWACAGDTRLARARVPVG